MGILDLLFGILKESGLDNCIVEKDKRTCREKIDDVLNREWISIYEIRKNVSTAEVDPFSEGNDFTYALYRDGVLRAVIRVFDKYSVFSRIGNRNIQRACEKKNIQCINFFTHLPNEMDYIENRFQSILS